MDDTRIGQVEAAGGWTSGGAVEVTGTDPVLASPWPIGDVAAVALTQVGLAAGALAAAAGADAGTVHVDVRDAAAATISFALMQVDGEPMVRTNASNPWVGRFRCADDRWIHLHGGFPPLAQRLADVLDLDAAADEETIATAVREWNSGALEEAIAARRGCAAIIRSADEWTAHPQGSVVAGWPAVIISEADVTAPLRWSPARSRPLAGLRVLDLTRVLAGPTCGRTLAAFGADVLHVRGPDVPVVPAFVVDTGHGKRQAWCDFTDPEALTTLRRLALDADVVVQGYRPGVLDRYGLGEDALRSEGFGGVFGSVSAYGHAGPWSDRAGWEQLAQSTSGLCLDPLGSDKPAMLPAAATDYTTGFVLAAGVMRALTALLADGRGRRVDASLCQTAAWIVRSGRLVDVRSPSGFDPPMLQSRSSFGVIDHLGPCVTVEGLDVGWDLPTTPLGDGTLTW